MPSISIFSGAFCNEKKVIQDVLEGTSHKFITDDMIIDITSENSGIPADKIRKAFSSKTSV